MSSGQGEGVGGVNERGEGKGWVESLMVGGGGGGGIGRY